MHLWTVKELEQHRCRDIHEIFAIKDSRKNPEHVKAFTDAYLQKTDEELNGSWNNGTPLLKRLLRANIESLPILQRGELLARFVSLEFLLIADKSMLRRIHDLCVSQDNPIDVVARVKNAVTQTFHNSFHYEALGFAQLIGDHDLAEFIERRIVEVSRWMDNGSMRGLWKRTLA